MVQLRQSVTSLVPHTGIIAGTRCALQLFCLTLTQAARHGLQRGMSLRVQRRCKDCSNAPA